jgi:MoaA/NifB/PqqE/SkfB family radical SAM enzyme
VKAVQVSLDGAAAASFNRMRVRGDFDRTVEGLRNLAMPAFPSRSTFRRAKFNMNEIGAVVDLAHELGAYSFYTGRTMYTGNAVKAWRHLRIEDDEYERFFDTLRQKATSIAAACACTSTKRGCSRSSASA